jgi:hypothetical protein
MVLLARQLGWIARHPVRARRADHENAVGEIDGAAEVVAALSVIGEQLLPFDASRLDAGEHIRRPLL